MRIAIGSDHAGLRLKLELAEWLRAQGHDVEDVGTHDGASTDYPDYAGAVAHKVASAEVERGVLVCGTGQGMAMSANKVAGVRAAVVSDEFSARMAARHNDARVLCFGERVVGPSVALGCLEAWLDSEFEGGRHARRVGKMTDLEGT